MEPIMITRRQTANLLNISLSTLDRLSASDPNFPPPIRLAAHTVRFYAPDVETWVKSQSTKVVGR